MKSNASFLDTYAWILFRLARYDDALIWIEKAITAGGSKSVTVIEHRGDVLIKLNRTEEAIEEWNKAAKMAEPSELLKRKINTKQYHEQ
jgi:predicted negative regulator of RcsB-dependent stress response